MDHHDYTEMVLIHSIRMNCCGFFDALQLRSSKSVPELQHEDLFALGKLILALACQNIAAVHHFKYSNPYSNDLHYTISLMVIDDMTNVLGIIAKV
jgi:hypothetical protein